MPTIIADPISKEIVQVLTIPRGGLLTISVLAAFYFASNGVEALRISLNRAYRVYDPRRWYITRTISLGYVLAASVALVMLSLFLVAAPLAVHYAGRYVPATVELMVIIDNWSIWGALATLLIALFIAHLFLPSGRRSFLDVLPGIVTTLIAWYVAAKIFSYYLSTFANYTKTYAGLASIMIALVFLYMTAVILMLGGELNAALMKYKVRKIVRRSFGRGDSSEPDPAADI